MEDTTPQQADNSTQLPISNPPFKKKLTVLSIIIVITVIVLIIYSLSKNISTLKNPSALITQIPNTPTISVLPTLSINNLKTHEIISPDGKNKLIKTEGIISVSINDSPFKNIVNFSGTNKYISHPLWSNDSLKIGFLLGELDSKKWDFYVVNIDGTEQRMVGSYSISKKEENDEGAYIINLIGFNNEKNEMYFIKETGLPQTIKGSLSILSTINGSIEKRPAFPVTEFATNITLSLNHRIIYSTDFSNIYEYNIQKNTIRTIYSVPESEVKDYTAKRMRGVDLSSMLDIWKLSDNKLIFKYLMYPDPDKIYSLDLNSLDVKSYNINE